MYYAIYCQNRLGTLQMWRSVRPAHLQRLKELEDNHQLLLAGSCLPDNQSNPVEGIEASLIIAQFESLKAAKEWAAADPYTTAQVYSRITVYPFDRTLLDDNQ
jgi:uncharacterized protein YciI